jgi:simple sugar transport system permease protein
MSTDVVMSAPVGLARFAGRALRVSRPLLGILLALLVSSIFIVAKGVSPLLAFSALLEGSLGSVSALANTAVRSSPLILGGLGVALGLKAGLLNVGMEGSMYMGAIGATYVALAPLGVPPWLHVTLVLVAAFFFGALWGLVPAILHVYRQANLIVLCLMLNYVGIYVSSLFVQQTALLREPGSFFPQSRPIQATARIPALIKGTNLHAGLFLGPILCVVLHIVLRYTVSGFRIRMQGANRDAASYAGVRVGPQTLLVMAIGSGLAGAAGAIEILGLKFRLFDGFTAGVGYETIAVGLLANGAPLGVLLAGLFFAALKAGGARMQVVTGVPAALAVVVQALCVLFVVGLGFAQKTSRGTRKTQQPGEGDLAPTGPRVEGAPAPRRVGETEGSADANHL